MTRKRKAVFEKRKPKGSPAYMGQYASLMTILLAFFIIMLTLGQNRVAQFKVGVGLIRNMVGLTGGSGVLDFWRTVRRPAAPRVFTDESEDPDARLLGYESDFADSYSLGGSGVESISFLALRDTLHLQSPIRFEPGQIRVSRESQSALDHAAALLYSFPEHRIVGIVRVHAPPGDAVEERRLAARRAAWLTRHLVEHGRIPAGRIRSLGQVRKDAGTGAPGETQVIFWLRRDTDQNIRR